MCGVAVYPPWAIPFLIAIELKQKAGRAVNRGTSNAQQSSRNATSKIESALKNMKNNVYNAFHEDTLQIALERDPNNPQLHVELAMDYLRVGETEQALKTLEHAVELSQFLHSSTSPLFYLAVVQTATYHADEAIVTCDLLLKKAFNTEKPQPGHKLLLTDFHKPTFCNACKKLLMGFRKQGYKCTICENAFHVECSKESRVCSAAVKAQQTPSKPVDSSHQLSDTIILKPTWCNTCNRMIRLNQHPKVCKKCENSFHPNCVTSRDYCLASPVESKYNSF